MKIFSMPRVFTTLCFMDRSVRGRPSAARSFLINSNCPTLAASLTPALIENEPRPPKAGVDECQQGDVQENQNEPGDEKSLA
jgi:hypothetical protein